MNPSEPTFSSNSFLQVAADLEQLHLPQQTERKKETRILRTNIGQPGDQRFRTILDENNTINCPFASID